MDYISQILDRANKTAQQDNNLDNEMTLDIGGTDLKVKRLPVQKIFELLNEAQDNEFEAELELIYLSAYDTFNNDVIMQLNKTHEPHNVVTCVFGDNPILIGQIARAIVNWYDLDKTTKVTVKALKKQ